MSQALALIVDDEPDILELLAITLARMQVACVPAPDLQQAKRALGSHTFDLCLTDMRLPDGDGITLVQHIAERHPQLPVAVITAYGSMQTAVEAMKAGAFDFVSKPVDLQVLRRLVNTALKLRVPPPQTGRGALLLGKSSAIERIRKTCTKLARSQAPVYISGESGTGKEVAARLIHEQGPRTEGRFVPVNCGAIPRDLVESELFGHRKGSFTGAVADKEGLFQAADGGTLFLDEVADLPLDVQVKLLRAIQEKAVRPIGGREEKAVDVRIISASHRHLGDLVSQGSFRQDLFYRIHVIELSILPLRERREDIPLLVEHFLARVAHQAQCPVPLLHSTALTRLLEHDFPGNVRELENILERATALCEDSLILPADLQLPERSWHASEPTAESAQPLEHYLDDVERQAILQALEETHWNRAATARKLGMTPRSLRYRLSKLGIG